MVTKAGALILVLVINACSTSSQPGPLDPDETFNAWCDLLAYCLDDADPVGICVEEYKSHYEQWAADYLSGENLYRCNQASLAWHDDAAGRLDCSDYYIHALYYGGPLLHMNDVPYAEACDPCLEHGCTEGMPCFRTGALACGLSKGGEPARLDCHYEGHWQLFPLFETCLDECSNYITIDNEVLWSPYCPNGMRPKSFDECQSICDEWNQIDAGENNCVAVETESECPLDQCKRPADCYCHCP